jgi:ABC-2 type transport system permease protein
VTAAATASTAARAPHPGFVSQLRAEWTKLRSTRGFYIEIGLALLLGVGMSALIALAVGSSWDQTSDAQKADFEPLFVSFFGLAFSGIVLTVMGTTLMSSEYTSGMIRLTMTVTPRRLRVLAAKTLLIAAVTWLVGVVLVVGAFLAGQAVLGTYDEIPTAKFGDGDAQRAILAAWVTTPVFPLIGLALGAILRSTASAITAVMALIFVPALFGGILPAWWQEHLLAYLPGNASDSLMRDPGNSITYIEPASAAVTLITWLAGFYILAVFLMRKRDV